MKNMWCMATSYPGYLVCRWDSLDPSKCDQSDPDCLPTFNPNILFYNLNGSTLM